MKVTDDDEDIVSVVRFDAITQDQPHYEICRLFLSSLVLCNMGNISLQHETGIVNDNLGVELLNSTIERPTHIILALNY